MNKDNKSTVAAVQNIIRKKFKNTYMNRIKREEDEKHALKPLTIIPPSSSSSASITDNLESKNNFSKTPSGSLQMHLPTKSRSIKINDNKKHLDPNTLCTTLRKLLLSSFSPHDIDVNRMHQINFILNELRELKIIS